MSLYRFMHEPFFSITEFDRLADEALGAAAPVNNQVVVGGREGSTSEQKVVIPRMDMLEDAEGNTLTAIFELPGLKKEDIEIDLHYDRLTMSGESSSSADEGYGEYRIRERHYGRFERTVRVPAGTKVEDVKANLEHGVLTVTFPKVPANQPEPQKIPVG